MGHFAHCRAHLWFGSPRTAAHLLGLREGRAHVTQPHKLTKASKRRSLRRKALYLGVFIASRRIFCVVGSVGTPGLRTEGCSIETERRVAVCDPSIEIATINPKQPRKPLRDPTCNPIVRGLDRDAP